LRGRRAAAAGAANFRFCQIDRTPSAKGQRSKLLRRPMRDLFAATTRRRFFRRKQKLIRPPPCSQRVEIKENKLQQAFERSYSASKGPQEFRIPQSKLISTWRARARSQKSWLSRPICRATALLEFRPRREASLCISEKVALAASVQMMRNLNCLLL
jgi:hypothetical protein